MWDTGWRAHLGGPCPRLPSVSCRPLAGSGLRLLAQLDQPAAPRWDSNSGETQHLGTESQSSQEAKGQLLGPAVWALNQIF